MRYLRGLARRMLRQDDHRAFIFQLLPKNSVGVEVGVWRGEFSASLIRRVRPRQLHLVDPWEFANDPGHALALYGGKAASNQGDMDQIYEEVRLRFEKEIAARRVVVHREHSLEAVKHFRDGELDWAYIDADHDYEAVSSDLAAWWVKVRPGGYLLGDDYGNVGWWGDGVVRAVNEFISTHGVPMVACSQVQFVVQRPSG